MRKNKFGSSSTRLLLNNLSRKTFRTNLNKLCHFLESELSIKWLKDKQLIALFPLHYKTLSKRVLEKLCTFWFVLIWQGFWLNLPKNPSILESFYFLVSSLGKQRAGSKCQILFHFTVPKNLKSILDPCIAWYVICTFHSDIILFSSIKTFSKRKIHKTYAKNIQLRKHLKNVIRTL